MKTFDVGMNPWDSALWHQFIPSVNNFTPSCAVFHSLPNSERQVIIYLPAKCLVKAPGKTELTCVELNLKILDGILLHLWGLVRLHFLPVLCLQDMCSGPERCFALPLLSFVPPTWLAAEGSQSSSSSFCHSQLEKRI